MSVLSIDIIQLQILGYTAISLLLGGLIGLDRELANRPAGIRTHSLVTGAATLFVSMGQVLVDGFHAVINVEVLRSDPIRLIEAVITGISFLGAGTIIRERSADRVHGLTTAASILISAAVGVCVALSQFILAFGVTVLVWIVLRLLHKLEKYLGTA